MTNLNAFLCAPLPFKANIDIYPAQVKDLTNPLFSNFQSILLMSQEEIEDLFEQQLQDDKNFIVPTPIEFLFINSYSNQGYDIIARQAFEFFIHKTVDFDYEEKRIIVFNEDGSNETISENEFFDFQNLLRVSMGFEEVEKPDENMHPWKKRMLALRRMRDKAKAKQNAKNGTTFIEILVAICCMNLGINPLNCGELSYASVNALVEIYQKKEKYELDINSLLAGADSKKVHPKYWIGNQN